MRDIAAASGVSMAAIGYHFGSREALLTSALIEAIDEWGTRLGRTLSAYGSEGASAAEHYEALWAAVIGSFTEDRTLWLATLEALVQAEHSDDLRSYLATGQAQGQRSRRPPARHLRGRHRRRDRPQPGFNPTGPLHRPDDPMAHRPRSGPPSPRGRLRPTSPRTPRPLGGLTAGRCHSAPRSPGAWRGWYWTAARGDRLRPLRRCAENGVCRAARHARIAL
ncbi:MULTISPECIES: TetR/AcrR family transcriptional regulator [unclassified Streptomyces]|uniref:TetR/AcrR family transcriptional regulator n=1 Tax=unclassified Streptomyces TaxID=2593676 RepID=UPI000ADA61D6|nr:TetR/AcrR family transcriptional regulator [Streptomyces sp. 2114.2]